MCFIQSTANRHGSHVPRLAMWYSSGGVDRVYYELGWASVSQSAVRRNYLEPLKRGVRQQMYNLNSSDYQAIIDVLTEYCSGPENGPGSSRYKELWAIHGTLEGSKFSPPRAGLSTEMDAYADHISDLADRM